VYFAPFGSLRPRPYASRANACAVRQRLGFDIAGAITLALGLIVSKKRAVELGVSRWSGESEADQLQLPQVKDRLSQSRNVMVGLALLVLGFLLQLVGNWPG